MLAMNLSTRYPLHATPLHQAFGSRVQSAVPLARYTAARLGGPADLLLEVETAQDLVDAVSLCWREGLPFVILGGGSNVLVSDAGVRGVVLVNRTRQVIFYDSAAQALRDTHLTIRDPQRLVWAESGVNFGLLARQAAQRGLAGLEWAVSIPGTVGGAVVGNAGAHGGDMAGNLVLAEILHRGSEQEPLPLRQPWPAEKLAFAYRSSVLKRREAVGVVLGAWLRLENSTPEAVQARMQTFIDYRKRTQPPGASLGSMFKNPPGDYAGRLIEAAGLKGIRIGDAQISPLHANFFINTGNCTAADIFDLIRLVQQTVAEKFAIHLELEIELLGEMQT
jgi:UDP-N-acetylmuramate dehydrogenase